MKVERIRQMRDDRVLRLQRIGAGRVELFGPEVSAAAGVDQLDIDPHPVVARLHRAFENIAHAQLLADRLDVDRLALEGHGRVARDDEGVVHAREAGGQSVGQGVDEVVLRRIADRLAKGSTTIERRAASAAALVATLAGRFALRSHHTPPAITMSSAASAAGSGNAERVCAAHGFADFGVVVFRGSTFAAAIASGDSA